MGSVYAYETQAGKRYEARYRKPDNKTARKGGFRLKREAEAYLATVEVSKLTGTYIAPADGQATVDMLGTIWLEAHHARVSASTLKASTFHSDESAWRIHVQTKWGKRSVGSIRQSEVKAWISVLGANRSATTVSRAYGVLASILDDAVHDKRLNSNPARGDKVKLPRKASAKRAYLTHSQIERLAAESKYPNFILFLTYTGLRWGEATGLRVAHLDRTRRRVDIRENAVSVNGHIIVGTPKTHEQRTVAYPAFLDSAIEIACHGKTDDALLFGDGVTHLRPGNADNGWFAAAVKRSQATDPDFRRVTPHDLRHTAASLAISAGANIKVLQRMLGHASAAMTLDRYADLFDDDLDTVAIALDQSRLDQLKQ
ncbi:integrase [Arthrobacter alpinus]|uniref:site-specific integrase n=1 Tax=Arthrobacter alpinus TaxID=656366 RepID=UPI0005C8482A|nr:site-specific integrase [Arthrobacter alpinus]ALV47195.1 integrase [Arthrobacter alpinus]